MHKSMVERIVMELVVPLQHEIAKLKLRVLALEDYNRFPVPVMRQVLKEVEDADNRGGDEEVGGS